MKKTIIAAIIGILALFAACTIPQDNKDYDNSTIILERSGTFTLPEYAIQKVTITQEGLLHETYYGNGTLSYSAYTEFTSNEYQQLIQTFQNSNFLELNNQYNSSIQVADVGLGIITLITHNATKEVTINPYIQEGNPNEITNIMEKLNNIINSAESPYNLPVLLTYQGIQCIEDPWETWYSEGNINFIQEPTEEELIQAYYSSKNVSINTIDTLSNEMVCEACEICPKQNYFEITIDKEHKDIFLQDGWAE